MFTKKQLRNDHRMLLKHARDYKDVEMLVKINRATLDIIIERYTAIV